VAIFGSLVALVLWRHIKVLPGDDVNQPSGFRVAGSDCNIVVLSMVSLASVVSLVSLILNFVGIIVGVVG